MTRPQVPVLPPVPSAPLPPPYEIAHHTPDTIVPCEQVVARLGNYVARTLPAEDESRVRLHLDGCPGCGRLAEEYQAVIRLAGRLPPVEPPPAVAARLRASLRRSLAANPTGDPSLHETRPERPLN